ncbi:MAG: ATP-binding cassette domain-containing protein [Candidatus Aminicenantes bacterium]|nr:ATP-binding cassette domain-containing protein [Candidatus Aminicenantes bacterium]
MKEIVGVKNLHVGYGDYVVLKDLNFAINLEEITVIVGKSGCGKSTVLKSLIGLLPPISGEIFFRGEKMDYLSETSLQTLYKQIGVLYQNSALLNSLTLYENIALPIKMRHPDLPAAIEREMVNTRLSQVGLLENRDKFPAELSGGMKKRAALARAIILDPAIIFCDEPSSGLDPITAGGLDELMLNLKEFFGLTFVVVTHELRSIEKIADNVLVLDNGGLHYFGPYRDLFTLKDRFIDTFFLKDINDDYKRTKI